MVVFKVYVVKTHIGFFLLSNTHCDRILISVHIYWYAERNKETEKLLHREAAPVPLSSWQVN